jgi:hypothetical protein
MPRIISGKGTAAPPVRFPDLVTALVHELRESGESGQPVIHEHHFPRTGKMRVTALWDRWENVPHEERAEIIRRAYTEVEGAESLEKLALLVGLTFPEAYEAGMLPYQVVPLLREKDPVSLEDCLKAMEEEGASRLFPGGRPELRSATKEEAEAIRKRLIKRLPGSEAVWAVLQEVGRIESANGIG